MGAGLDSHSSRFVSHVRKGLQQRSQHLTFAADLHLFPPIFLNRTLANGSIYKPAELSASKFPGRALLLQFRRAFFNHPARFRDFRATPSPWNQEKDLPLHMGWYRSPSLFIAVNSLDRCPEQLPHLLLGLAQHFSKVQEFFTVHRSSSKISL